MNSKQTIISLIENITEEVPGWTPVDQLFAIFNLVYMNPYTLGDIIEIGSWCGRSTAVLGLAAKLTGNAHIHCIDLSPSKNDWFANSDGTYSFKVRINSKTHSAFITDKVWSEPYHRDILPIYNNYESIFDAFHTTITKYGLEKLVTAHRGTSSTIIGSLQDTIKCKVAFIDGDHSYESVSDDIENIEKILVPGGWICFDDAFSSYAGVDKAINDHIINNPQYRIGCQLTRKFFVAQRVK